MMIKQQDRLDYLEDYSRKNNIRIDGFEEPHFDRDSAMKNKMKLKGTGIYMNEDLCENTLKARKDKMDQFKQAKLSGKTAFFNGKTLIIREKRINNADNNLQPCNTPARPVSELIETFTPASNESNVTTQLQHSPALNNRL